MGRNITGGRHKHKKRKKQKKWGVRVRELQTRKDPSWTIPLRPTGTALILLESNRKYEQIKGDVRERLLLSILLPTVHLEAPGQQLTKKRTEERWVGTNGGDENGVNLPGHQLWAAQELSRDGKGEKVDHLGKKEIKCEKFWGNDTRTKTKRKGMEGGLGCQR